MFAAATRGFVEEVDHGGLLIPVCSLNDPIAVLTVVVRRKRFWFWQKPKYQPTDFDLNDLLTGDEPVKPGLVETDFIKYSGTFGDNVQGSVDAGFVGAGVNVAGKDSFRLQSAFGGLKKEEVDVQKLLRDCGDRVLDMSHSLIQQTREKSRRAFGVVKERIVTTQPCSVVEEVQQGGQCGGNFNSCGPNVPKVSLKENGSVSKDSNVTMEIPANTAIAYGLMELEVRRDGRFELCLTSDVPGGFEVDGPVEMAPRSPPGAPRQSSQKAGLREELDRLSGHFQVLSDLPAPTRAALLQRVTQLMQDKAAVTALQRTLDEVILDQKPDLSRLGVTESQRQSVKSILELLGEPGCEGPAGSRPAAAAVHLLTCTLEELSDDGLAALARCRGADVLQALERLVRCVSGSGETPRSAAEATQDAFEGARRLFALSNVSLERDGGAVKTEINPQPGHLPLVLAIAVTALASLARSV